MARPTLNLTDSVRRAIIEDRATQAMRATEPRPMAVSNTSRFNGRGDLAHAGYRYSRHDGEHYEGGLGPVEILYTDYWSQYYVAHCSVRPPGVVFGMDIAIGTVIALLT